jgi:hypothetical protein
VHINSGNYDEAEALLVQTIEEGGRIGTEGVQRNSTGDQRARQLRAQQGQSQPGAHSPGPGGAETGMHLPVVLDAMSNLGHMYTEQVECSLLSCLMIVPWVLRQRVQVCVRCLPPCFWISFLMLDNVAVNPTTCFTLCACST